MWWVMFFVSHGTFRLHLRVCCGIQADMTSINLLVAVQSISSSWSNDPSQVPQSSDVPFCSQHLCTSRLFFVLCGLACYCVSIHFKRQLKAIMICIHKRWNYGAIKQLSFCWHKGEINQRGMTVGMCEGRGEYNLWQWKIPKYAAKSTKLRVIFVTRIKY